MEKKEQSQLGGEQWEDFFHFCLSDGDMRIFLSEPYIFNHADYCIAWHAATFTRLMGSKEQKGSNNQLDRYIFSFLRQKLLCGHSYVGFMVRRNLDFIVFLFIYYLPAVH